MEPSFLISQAVIDGQAGQQSQKRGRDYFRQGAVQDLYRRDQSIFARVVGSRSSPYQVELHWHGSSFNRARCTCPYSYGDWCKHIVATALATNAAGQKVIEKPSLATILDGLDQEQLRSLVEVLLQSPPEKMLDPAAAIDPWINSLTKTIQTQVVGRSQSENQTSNNQNQQRQGQQHQGKKGKSDRQSQKPAIAANLTINPQAFKQRIQWKINEAASSLVEYDSYYDEYSALEEAINDFRQEVGQFHHKKKYTEAFLVLSYLCDALVSISSELNQAETDLSVSLEEIDADFAAIILDLLDLMNNPSTEDDHQAFFDPMAFAEALVGWEDYLDIVFLKAKAALFHDWQNPNFLAILAGDLSVDLPLLSSDQSTNQDIYSSIIQQLKAKERYAEALHLAEVLGLNMVVIELLVQLDQIEELLSQANAWIETVDLAAFASQILLDHGDQEAAFVIAKRGLTLWLQDLGRENTSFQKKVVLSRGYQLRLPEFQATTKNRNLAELLRDLATEFNEPELVLAAHRMAFHQKPSLDTFVNLMNLAGDQTAELKQECFSILNQAGRFVELHHKIDIFLHERCFDLAMDLISQLGPNVDKEIVIQVIKAVQKTHPEWVAEIAQQQAERIINNSLTRDYPNTVTWLKYMKSAYTRLDAMQKWEKYQAWIVKQHGRKYKLMGFLRDANLV